MKRGCSLTLLAASALLLTPEAQACRFCRGGPEDDRFGVNDPYNAFQPSALVEQYRTDAPAVPKSDEIVTNAKDLAAAMAAAQLPGAPAAPEGSARARLAKMASSPVPTTVAVGATAPASKSAAPVAKMELPRTQPLGDWTSRFLDASLLAGLVGVGYFFTRRGRA
ncbi:MAG: hypothetical protein JSR82_16610 [Verrucomicrobia bacterium]|nr:hypothetical protein [Verrucomicrobiota bacterium]